METSLAGGLPRFSFIPVYAISPLTLHEYSCSLGLLMYVTQQKFAFLPAFNFSEQAGFS